MSSNDGQVSSGLNLWLDLKDPKQMGELLARLLAQGPAINDALNSLHYVHFARFLPTPDGSALQVITSFDGELDAYVLDFVLAIGDQFDTILSYVKTWPGEYVKPGTSVKDDPAGFLAFVRDWDLGYGGAGSAVGIGLYSAYPNRTVIDIVGSAKKAPGAAPREPVVVDRRDVQSNILHGMRWEHAWHAGLRIGSGEKARDFLTELLKGKKGTPQISSDAEWTDRPTHALTVGFTYAGLVAIGITDSDRAAFGLAHQTFVDGGIDAATANGDVDESRPEFWELGGAEPVDMVISLYAGDEAQLKLLEKVEERAKAHQLTVLEQRWHAEALPNPDEKNPDHRLVHFGYVDGLSQPRLAIEGEPVDPEEMQPRANVGEFLLGAAYPNVFGGGDSLGGLSPALAQNATFAALRIMEQDVAGFERMLDEASDKHGVEREWLAAKIMGRWRDGTPVVLAPDPDSPRGKPSNQFDYLPSANHPDTPDDSKGFGCPFGAHARRMNPRSATVAGRPHSRRLLRRGMPYGQPYDPKQPDDGEKRGMVGLFICADLNRQFEFILRQWAHGDRATSGLVGQQDPIVGAQAKLQEGRPMDGEYRIPREGKKEIVIKTPRLVKTVGSVYLFMPGLAGLRYLAKKPSIFQRVAGWAKSWFKPGTTPAAPAAKPELVAPAAADAEPATPVAIPAPATPTARVSQPAPATEVGAVPPPPDPAAFDPRAKPFRDDPFPIYKSFRAHQPVVRLPKMGSTWVFSHDAVTEAVDTSKFCKRRSTDTSEAGLLSMDPPPHTACRREIQLLFDQALAAMTAQNIIPQLVSTTYQQGCQGKGLIDWVAAFARPVAQKAFFELFGLKPEEASGLIRDVETVLQKATPASDERAWAEIAEVLAGRARALFLSRYTGPTPRQGSLLDGILKMQTLHDPVHNRRQSIASALQVEQITNAITLAMAGFLPLQWFIAVATWRLLEKNNNVILLQQLQSDRTIADSDVVDELLRFDMTTPLSNRFVAADGTELGGVKLAKDDRVVVCFSSANRDPGRFDKPDEINFKRAEGKKGPGWAFGPEKEHWCMGRDLVYLVMEEVIKNLRNANPTPQLDPGFRLSWGLPSERAMFRAMANLKVRC